MFCKLDWDEKTSLGQNKITTYLHIYLRGIYILAYIKIKHFMCMQYFVNK